MGKKNIEKLALLFAAAVWSMTGMVSCNKGLETYSGEPGLYFAMSIKSSAQNTDTLYSETTLLPFATTVESDSVLNLRVKILGNVADRDRTFIVRTVEEETDLLPEDLEPLKEAYILPAGEVYGVLPLHFRRSASLAGKERKICLELVENEDFKLPIHKWKNGSSEYVDVIRHTVIVSDKYVQLPGYSEYFFGPFSEKKMRILLELSGKELNEFNEKLSHIYCRALGQQLDRYLQEQAAKGTPVLEEDGTPMVSGSGIYK